MHDDALITDPARLAALCDEWSREEWLALDTEFIRERTYYPQLCLVQIGTSQGAWAVDPLAPGMDLAPLLKLLADPRMLKVFHAGRQDMEIFYHLMGYTPSPVFDTQIAAQVCGFGESVSYEAIVQKTVGKSVDKGARFTDWAKRPLSERQLTYALQDVIYLRGVYDKLHEFMARQNRMEWIAGEMEKLTDHALYDAPEEDAWKRLRFNGRKPESFAALQAIAAWREREAKRMDVPRGRLVRDDLLTEIALAMPRTLEDLHHLRGTQNLSKTVQKGLVEAIDAALAGSPAAWPKQPTRPREEPALHRHALSLLQLLLEVQAEKHRVTARMIATRDELEAMARGTRDIAPLQGWRGEVFGAQALKLLSGEIALSVDTGGGVCVKEVG